MGKNKTSFPSKLFIQRQCEGTSEEFLITNEEIKDLEEKEVGIYEFKEIKTVKIKKTIE